MYEEAEDRPPSICGGCKQDSTLQSVGNSSRGQDPLRLQGTLSEVRAPSICRGPIWNTPYARKSIPYARSRREKNPAVNYMVISHISQERMSSSENESVSEEYERKEGMNYHYASSTDWETECPRKIKWCKHAQFCLLLRQIYQTDALKHMSYPANSPCSDFMLTSYLLII